MYLLSQYLLSIYYVPGTIRGSRVTEIKIKMQTKSLLN